MNPVGRKTCYRCGRSKSLSLFTQRRDGRFYDMCGNCVSEILQRRRPQTKAHLHLLLAIEHATSADDFYLLSTLRVDRQERISPLARTATSWYLPNVGAHAFLQPKASSRERSGKAFLQTLTHAPIASAHGTRSRFCLVASLSLRLTTSSRFL
jgi:hypothetical protein